jgi:DNA-binding LacI/PurR family transcriptional regulator
MREMATVAVERVLARMKNTGEAPHELVFVPTLVVRESTAAFALVNQSRSQQR